MKKRSGSVSREKMFEYLYRHKLQKRYRRIRPHTYANSLGLTTQKLQKQSSIDVKKPIVNQNVKARLEGNLEYLLENQNLITTRVKNPASYMSLNLKRLKGGSHSNSASTIAKSTNGSNHTADTQHNGSNREKERDSGEMSASALTFKSAAQRSGHQLMPPPPSLTVTSGKQYQKKRPADQQLFNPPLASNRSVSFDTVEPGSFDFNIESHNLITTRAKNPENYLSMNSERLKGESKVTKSTQIGETMAETHHTGFTRGKDRDPSALTFKSVALLNAEHAQRNGHRLMPPPPPPSLPGKSSKHQQKKRSAEEQLFRQPLASNRSAGFDIADSGSFDFRGDENQNRVNHRFMSTTSSKSHYAESKKRPSEIHSRSRARNSPPLPPARSSHLSPFEFDNDSFFQCSPAETRGQVVHTPRTLPTYPNANNDFTDAPDPFFEAGNFDIAQSKHIHSNQSNQRSHLGSSGHVSNGQLITDFELNRSTARRSGSSVVRTRIVKTSVGRVGESPFMEQICIQKVKHKY